MKRTLTALTLLAVLALPAGADPSPGKAARKDAKAVTIPFELLKSKHIAVKIKVNGKGPYRVIFDTGAPMILLSKKFGKEVGLKSSGLLGLPQPVKAKSVELGSLKVEKIDVIVMDHPTVSLMSKVLGPIEGIVGLPFFARYRMTIDYQAKTLTFVPNGFKPPDVMNDMMGMVNAIMASSKKQQPPQVLAPAAQWGIVAAKADDDQNPGVTVKRVRPGTAAAVAGLKAGDRLLVLDDRWTDSINDLFEAAGLVPPGTAVKVKVKRDGKEMELTVKPVSGL